MSAPLEPGDPGENDLPDIGEDLDLPEDDLETEEAEAPEAAEEELEEPLPQPQRQSRRERQADNWRDRAMRAEAERDLLRNQPQRQEAPRVDPQLQQQQRQQEYNRISMLPPEEQAAAYHQMMQREVALARLEAFDLNDRSNFERLKSSHPAASRLGNQVETILREQRAQGVYSFSREQIYHYLLGQEVHNRSTQNAGRQRAQGQRNVARQTTRAVRTRGDVATGNNRTRGDDADRKLLEGTLIRDL